MQGSDQRNCMYSTFSLFFNCFASYCNYSFYIKFLFLYYFVLIMTQAILNSVSSEWKTQAKHIRFINGTDDPSFSDNKLDIYSSKFEGELSLSQFPNLRSIAFQSNISANSLESIDISENAKLNKIVLS